MPKPLSKPDYVYVAETLRWLDEVDKESDSRKCASLYIKLAKRFCFQHMYSRAIAMYQKSLEVNADGQDSFEVRRTLAQLLIQLYGKDGFDEARALVRDSRSIPRDWIEDQIKNKQEAIARHEQKATFEKDYHALKAIVGESQNILQICEKIIQYAPSSAPVLITGDSGTGKEVVARALAEVSGRKLIPFNCGAVAEGMLESELFGHVKGAFTGAVADKKGLFETPGDQVIFLDEIGDTSPKFQVALLRVIENRTFSPVGAPHTSRTLATSTKLVCATAKNLTEEVKAARFRDDLLQRIQALSIRCEPLANRPEDVRLLVRHVLATDSDMQRYGPFSEYDIDFWTTFVYRMDKGVEASTGNIRELLGQVRRAVLEGKFPQKGDRPFVDRWGAMTYTKEEIEQDDWSRAVDVCKWQKDACRLMGLDEKKGQKHLKKLNLSKQQRKRQAPQA
jgi:transcriptional regulator with GAF, ATPase, and Fis domain